MSRASTFLAALGIALGACTRSALPPLDAYCSEGPPLPLPANAVPVPLVRQKVGYSCGDAAVLALMRYWHPRDYATMSEQDLYAPLGTTSQDGTDPAPMAAYVDRVPGLHAELARGASEPDLVASIDRGEPVIVDLQAWQPHRHHADFTPWEADWDDGHYAVLLGYDDRAWFFMDPSTEGRYAYVPRAELPRRWHDVLRTGERIERWAIFVHSSVPGPAPAARAPAAAGAAPATPLN